jgi:hypothetical protein
MAGVRNSPHLSFSTRGRDHFLSEPHSPRRDGYTACLIFNAFSKLEKGTLARTLAKLKPPAKSIFSGTRASLIQVFSRIRPRTNFGTWPTEKSALSEFLLARWSAFLDLLPQLLQYWRVQRSMESRALTPVSRVDSHCLG